MEMVEIFALKVSQSQGAELFVDMSGTVMVRETAKLKGSVSLTGEK